jgi:rare lipoprotein A
LCISLVPKDEIGTRGTKNVSRTVFNQNFMVKKISSFIILFVFGFASCTFFAQKQANLNPDKKSLSTSDSIKKDKTLTVIRTSDTIILVSEKLQPYKENAHASYYADKFHGLRTASGKIFDMNKLTAAHKKLPFGTKVKVTNESNGKSVIVEITDRGPFVKGREIDLSKKAFMTIASSKNSGAVIVTLEIMPK